MLDETIKKTLLTAQKNEITEHFIYKKLARSTTDPHNKKILEEIAKDERKHYNFWKKYTNRDVRPIRLKQWFYYLIARIFGLTFGIKLMEKGESAAQVAYEMITHVIPEAKSVLEDEEVHESQLIRLINE